MNNPDLNPIENFWSHPQWKVEANGCRVFSEFREALEAWAAWVPPASFFKLVESRHEQSA